MMVTIVISDRWARWEADRIISEIALSSAMKWIYNRGMMDTRPSLRQSIPPESPMTSIRAADSLDRGVRPGAIPPTRLFSPVFNRRRPLARLSPAQPGQGRQRDEKERAQGQERLVDAGGGGGALEERLDEILDRRVDRAERRVVKAFERQADEARGDGIAGLEAGDEVGGMGRGARLQYGVDEGDPYRAAEIAHQVEEPAGIGERGARLAFERHRHGRQDAQHDAGAAQDLRPDQPGEIGLRGGATVGEEAGGEDAITERRQLARGDALVEHRGERGAEKLRHAGDDHDLADLQGGVAAHIEEEARHEIDCAVESAAEHEAVEAAAGEAAVAQQAQIDERRRALEA